MQEKKQTIIKWPIENLKSLVEDKKSRIYCKHVQKHVALHPYHLNDFKKSLGDVLRPGVNSYDPELKGLVLEYKNPKLVSELGAVFFDSHFIHVDIEAEFYTFKPKVGCKLKGIINKKLNGHLGALIYQTFNASIISHDEDKELWQKSDLSVGNEVNFIVTQIDLKSRLPFIRGRLVEEEEEEEEEEKEEEAQEFPAEESIENEAKDELDFESFENDKLEDENAEKEIANKLKLKKKEKSRLKNKKLENEAKDELDFESFENDKLENENNKLEDENAEKEIANELKLKKKEKSRLKKEKLENERLEEERIEKENSHKLKLEKKEKSRLKKEKLEKERLENEKLEQEKIEQENLNKSKPKKEKTKKIKKEKIEQETYNSELELSKDDIENIENNKHNEEKIVDKSSTIKIKIKKEEKDEEYDEKIKHLKRERSSSPENTKRKKLKFTE